MMLFSKAKKYSFKVDIIKNRRGVAMVTVLLLVVLFTVGIISLFVRVGDERKRSGSFLEVARSEMLVEVGLQEALAKIMDGSEVPYEEGVALGSMAAAPGQMQVRRYDLLPNRGYQLGEEAWGERAFFRDPFRTEYEREEEEDWQAANPRLIPLYSHKYYAPGLRYEVARGDFGEEGNSVEESSGNPDYNPARYKNMNTKKNPFYPGELYFGGALAPNDVFKGLRGESSGEYVREGEEEDYRYREGESAENRPLWVQWVPVRKYPDKGVRYENEEGVMEVNPIVGRVAYWVDVENSKVNLMMADRDYRETRLGMLLGESDAEAGMSGGSYFEQSRESNNSEGMGLRWDIEKWQLAPARQRITSYTGSGYMFSPQDSDRNTLYKHLLDGSEYAAMSATDAASSGAAAYWDLWFGWPSEDVNGDGVDDPPYVESASMVDWGMFEPLGLYREGMGVSVGMSDLVRGIIAERGGGMSGFEEVYSLLDPSVKGVQEKLDRGMMRKALENSFTIYGWDDERDPLGRAKIDITEVQRLGAQALSSGSFPSPDENGNALEQLLYRLEDPKYYRAYYSGAYASGGENRSFAQGMNRFVGDADEGNDANGSALVKQMVANIIEYRRGHDETPYINEQEGIVGAKSMPYVAEVATRARNGIWALKDLLPPGGWWDQSTETATQFANRLITNYIVLGGGSGTAFPAVAGTGRGLDYYLQNVLIDVAMGMVNPNPFAKNEFDGTVALDYWWDFPEGWWDNYQEDPWIFSTFGPDYDPADYPDVNRTEAIASFKGVYAMRPLSGDFHVMSHLGVRAGVSGEKTPYFNLGFIPGGALYYFGRLFTSLSPDAFPALKIEGWEIRKGDENGPLYHKVPIRHLNQIGDVTPWWDMSGEDSTTNFDINPGMQGSNTYLKVFYDWSGTRVGKDVFLPHLHSLAQYDRPSHILSFRTTHPGSVPVAYLVSGAIMEPNYGINATLRADSDANISSNGLEDKPIGWFTDITLQNYFRYIRSGQRSDYFESIPGYPFSWVASDTKNIYSNFFYLSKNLINRTINAIESPTGSASVRSAALDVIRNLIVNVVEKDALVERVISMDPTLGHRTSNPDILDDNAIGTRLWSISRTAPAATDVYEPRRTGHFYGVNGHSWRRYHHFQRETPSGITGIWNLPDVKNPAEYVFPFKPARPLKMKEVAPSSEGKSASIIVPIGNGQKVIAQNYMTKEAIDFTIVKYKEDKQSIKVYNRHRHPTTYLYYITDDNHPDFCLTHAFSNPWVAEVDQEAITGAVLLDGELFSREVDNFLPKKYGSFGPTYMDSRGYFYNEYDWRFKVDVEKGAIASLPSTGGLSPSPGSPIASQDAAFQEERQDTYFYPYSYGYALGLKMGHAYFKENKIRPHYLNFQGKSLFCSAPAGQLMRSIGEIGFCHSGLLGRPIELTRPPRRRDLSVGLPKYGPPMHMLLDLLTPGSFRDKETGAFISKSDWERGNYVPNSPERPPYWNREH